ncbi:MAG: lamin tail domain-containing protein, partial [Candidatus Hydrogenedentes bacterium]|nr:lamin tail domain-containing protein [Candidatus Hydrogenedentota bacterium]
MRPKLRTHNSQLRTSSPPQPATRNAQLATRAVRARGAALIIVLAIMTILFAIGLTFYAVSRIELKTATNVTNSVRVDLLSDAAMAIAIAHLNQDFFNHPGATSTDHAWRSIFNGSWVAGKPWALRSGVPLEQGGLPEVDLNSFPYIDFFDDAQGPEPLYRSLRTRDWLSIPRREGGIPVIYAEPGTYQITDAAGTPLSQAQFAYQTFDLTPDSDTSLGDVYRERERVPFVLSSFFGYPYSRNNTPWYNGSGRYPLEEADAFNDVDNDGDGLRDAIWIPLPSDVFFPINKLDDDLDGEVDELVNKDAEGNIVAAKPAADGRLESPSHVYWGGEDGLDNDGDGLVDTADSVEAGISLPEADVTEPIDPRVGIFLTAPLPGILIKIDLNGNGIIGDAGIDLPGDPIQGDDGDQDGVLGDNGDLVWLPNPDGTGLVKRVPIVRLPDEFIIDFNGVDVRLTASDVDKLDNDYNLIINDYSFYAYLDPSDPTDGRVLPSNPAAVESLSYGHIALQTYFSTFYNNDLVDAFSGATLPTTAGTLVLTHSGEPVCDLVGRAAILITDEASKVNLNATGGHTMLASAAVPVRSIGQINLGATLFTAPSSGATIFEYDTRVLPIIGQVLAGNLWGVLTGTPKDTRNLTNEFLLDTMYPGYGRADDDGNALLLAMNRRDDDGDGLVDEGLYLPADTTDPLFSTYAGLLGSLEGIDEPGELQRVSPTRNLLAEGAVSLNSNAPVFDTLDNDLDGVFNEIGELGDQQFQNARQIPALTPGIADARFAQMRPLVTPFSTDRSVSYFLTESGIRGVNRIDFNFATPQQIAANLMAHGDFIPVTKQRITHPVRTNDLTRYISVPQDPALENNILGFVEGLRQADIHLTAPSRLHQEPYQPYYGGFLHYTDPVAPNDVLAATLGPVPRTGNSFVNQDRDGLHQLPADRELQAMQAAANITDNRDRDYARSVLTSENINLVVDNDPNNPTNPWPDNLNAREVVPEDQLMPLEEVEDQIRKTLNAPRTLESVDSWLMHDVDTRATATQPLMFATNNNGDPIPEERHISYTVAGQEAIRINELMVRPVRRVEAEAVPNLVKVTSDDPIRTNVAFTNVPGNFDPTPFGNLYPAGSSPPIMPDFDVRRRTLAQVMGGPAQWAISGSTIGANSAAVTSVPAFTYTFPDGGPTILVGNVIEFIFVPTPDSPETGYISGLPGGRYYLTLNAMLGGTQYVTGNDQLEYSIKYVPLDGNGDPTGTIVDDIVSVINTPADPTAYFDQFWAFVPAQHIAFNNPGLRDGWVFLDGTPQGQSPLNADPGFNPNGTYFLDGGGILPGSDPFATGSGAFTNTVTMPPAGSNVALCVALRIRPGSTLSLGVNFFDFSQEPDHEYVELANTSDQVVDITGWQLEIGIPDANGAQPDAFKSIWQIPESTQIAPGGMLLLAANKFDVYRRQDYYFYPGQGEVPNPTVPNQRHKISTNGIGMAASSDYILNSPIPARRIPFDGITVPPIRDLSPFPSVSPAYSPSFNPGGGSIDGPFYDQTGSVFSRLIHPASLLLNDYVDNDGDGLTSGYLTYPFNFNPQGAGFPLSVTDLDTDSVFEERQIMSTPILSDGGGTDQPWDRIVELRSVSLEVVGGVTRNLASITSVDDVARLVLRGGILPNYPDHDGVDNDGDGAYFPINGPVPVPGALDEDMVDNDLDGRIDEQALGGSILTSEGVDEGAGVGAGSYRAGTLSYRFYRDRSLYPERLIDSGGLGILDTPNDASGNDNPLHEGANNFLASEIAIVGDLTAGNGENYPAMYTGSDYDPPDWKAFTERRWYPGDNVIVTLYEGNASQGKVADRVAYAENDVINRSVDDIVPSSYVVNGTTVCLNQDYPRFWLPNQMGLDFYRSLERKHPLYGGDRFGTRNRWQATDGNYDDWADSLSVFDAQVSITSWPYFVLAATQQARFISNGGRRLFGHALWGTPLRMNVAHRLSTNPPDLAQSFLATPREPLLQFAQATRFFDGFEALEE